jgi:hemerythrin-like domain-containing protein
MREASEAHPFESREFADAADRYIPLLEQHIFKENNVLFRMAERVMSEADDAYVIDKFSQVERERGFTGLLDSFGSELARWEEALR